MVNTPDAGTPGAVVPVNPLLILQQQQAHRTLSTSPANCKPSKGFLLPEPPPCSGTTGTCIQQNQSASPHCLSSHLRTPPPPAHLSSSACSCAFACLNQYAETGFSSTMQLGGAPCVCSIMRRPDPNASLKNTQMQRSKGTHAMLSPVQLSPLKASSTACHNIIKLVKHHQANAANGEDSSRGTPKELSFSSTTTATTAIHCHAQRAPAAGTSDQFHSRHPKLQPGQAHTGHLHTKSGRTEGLPRAGVCSGLKRANDVKHEQSRAEQCHCSSRQGLGNKDSKQSSEQAKASQLSKVQQSPATRASVS